MSLTEADADCGTTAGLAYIKDNRTITHVTMGVIVSESGISIAPAVDGEYLKGHVVACIDMQCVSTGRLERQLLDKIKAQL